MVERRASDDSRDRRAIEAARRYYLDGVPTPVLATEFGVSASTVSRWLSLAKDRGWVRIEILDPLELSGATEGRVIERFGLASATAVPETKPTAALTTVARRSSRELRGLVHDGITVGVAWGTTMAALAGDLPPLAASQSTVVQLNGAGSVTDLGISYAEDILARFSTAWHGTTLVFPVPAFFDHASTRDALWRERSIQRVRDVQRSCDLAVFSVGSTTAQVPSRVYQAGYLTAEDRSNLEVEGAVGDIATNFYRADGSFDGISLNSRASGLPLDALREIPTRLCIAAGTGKATAVAAALRGGYVTHLVTDLPLMNAVEELTRGDA